MSHDPTARLILDRASTLVTGQRATDYGDAEESFQRVADLWAPILGVKVQPHQVALCMTQLKIARLVNSPTHGDSWVDAAGYIGLGGQVVPDDAA